MNFSGTPTSELLPDLKEFPEPPLDLTSDCIPVEDPTKSKSSCQWSSESIKVIKNIIQSPFTVLIVQTAPFWAVALHSLVSGACRLHLQGWSVKCEVWRLKEGVSLHTHRKGRENWAIFRARVWWLTVPVCPDWTLVPLPPAVHLNDSLPCNLLTSPIQFPSLHT
jgi:hypothetical protein